MNNQTLIPLSHNDTKISLAYFNNEINKIVSGKYSRSRQITVCNEPNQKWVDIGLNNAKIVMPVAVYFKATKDKHNVDENIIRHLPVLLENPLYIFKSSSDNISFVAVLKAYEIKDNIKKPLIAVIKPVTGKATLNIVASIYGKDENFIEREINKGNLLYQEK